MNTLTQNHSIAGIVINAETRFSVDELCHICQVSRELLVEMVAEGIAEPAGTEPANWRFSGTSIARLRTAIRLQRDLHVNLAGVALALDLLDELERLRQPR